MCVVFSKALGAPTVLSLIAVNVFTIVAALFFNWSVIEVMFLYIIQSLIIGLFNFLKMVSISINSSEGLGAIGSIFALFFLVHYGAFHAGYLFF